jgi:hypothetical protein
LAATARPRNSPAALPVQEERHGERDGEQVPVDGGGHEDDRRGGQHHRVPWTAGPFGRRGFEVAKTVQVGAAVLGANRVQDGDRDDAADEKRDRVEVVEDRAAVDAGDVADAIGDLAEHSHEPAGQDRVFDGWSR